MSIQGVASSHASLSDVGRRKPLQTQVPESLAGAVDGSQTGIFSTEKVDIQLKGSRSAHYFRLVLEDIQEGLNLVRVAKERINGQEGLQNSLLRLFTVASKAASGRELSAADQHRVREEIEHLQGFITKIASDNREMGARHVPVVSHDVNQPVASLFVHAHGIDMQELLDMFERNSDLQTTAADAMELVAQEQQRLEELDGQIVQSLDNAMTVFRSAVSRWGGDSESAIASSTLGGLSQHDSTRRIHSSLNAQRVHALID